jgi:hypothetical protein
VTAVERGVVGLAHHAAGGVEDRERLRELGEVAVVLHRRVAADLALTDERRTVDGAERHRVTADVDAVLGVAGLDVELAGRLGHLLEDEVGVEEDRLVLHLLAVRPEQLDGAGVGELDADLAHQPSPPAVEGGHRLLRENFVSGHLVAEHAFSCLTS